MSENTEYSNPFSLLTRHAANVFGALVREWTLQGLPKSAEDQGSRFVLGVDSFIDALAEKGALIDRDYVLRDGVTEVCFYLRQPHQACFLLPEVDAINRFETGTNHSIKMPTQYLEIMLSEPLQRHYRTPYANYAFELEEEDYQEFLDPFMASYMCMQCA